MVPTDNREGRGRVGDDTHCLQPPSHSGIALQIPGLGPFGIIWILAGSDSELAESAAEMGAVVISDWTGGGRCADVRNVLPRGGSGGAPLQVVAVGHVTAGWGDSGRLSPSGNTMAEEVDTTEERGRYMDISSPGEGDEGDRNVGVRDLYHTPSEHRHTIYRNMDHYRPVSGSGEASIGVGFKAVVVTGGNQPGGDTGGGASGGGGEGLRGAGGRGVGGRDGKLRQMIL